jgi:hypothetical protein
MEYGNVDTKAKGLELTGLPWKKKTFAQVCIFSQTE